MNKHKGINAAKSIAAFRKTLYEIAEITLKPIKKDVTYTGEEILCNNALVGAPGIKEMLKKANLDYDLKEQNRDALTVFLFCVYRLGYSVGYEHNEENIDFYKRMDTINQRVIEHLQNELTKKNEKE